jgi:O-antigen/teichoic acid export membrane protein
MHGTAWMMFAQVAGMVFQTVYFIILARALGVDSFGALAASLAVVGILVPFAAWGFGNVLVMEVARTPSMFPIAYGSALISIAVGALVLIPLALVIGVVLLPAIPIAVFVFLGLAELVFARIVDLASLTFQAIDRLSVSAAFQILVPGFRCAAVFVFFFAPGVNDDLVAWTALYAAGTLIAAIISTLYVHYRVGKPVLALADVRGKLKIGGLFAVSAGASGIYADIDKMMLARLSTFEATGIYAAAYRAVGMAFMPVAALLAAAYPRFFRAGAHGIKNSADYARKLAVPSFGYGVAAGVAIFVLAPLAPYILGSDFQQSVDALRWLAPLPALSSLAYLFADALTGVGAQGLRALLQIGAATLNIGLNLLLIPDHSWRGAAWATLASVGALAAALWITVMLMERRARLTHPAGEPRAPASPSGRAAG